MNLEDRSPRRRRRRRRRPNAAQNPQQGQNMTGIPAEDRPFDDSQPQSQSQSQPQSQPRPFEGREGRRRRSRRRRRRGGGGGGADYAAGEPTAPMEPLAPGEAVPVQGVLFLKPNGHGILVNPANNYVPQSSDPLIHRALIEKFRLQPGLQLSGPARRTGGGLEITAIDQVEGLSMEDFQQSRRPFSELISIDPNERFVLETEQHRLTNRVLDLLAPIGKGQRCLIVSPPKAGKTTILKDIAHGIETNHPEAIVMVLLVDERPEEVTDMRRSVKGEVIASSSDETAENHITIAEVVLERARRLVELKKDVVILCDSITRMSRAYNNEQRSSGRILSGGIDARTMEKPRRFFGSARNAEDWGSLTIVATALVDTGSRMDEVIFQEFKGTGNTEIVLERGLFERRIFPAMNIAQSGTRKEEKLLPPEWLPKVHTLRRALAGTDPTQAMRMLLERLQKFPSNEAFLKSF